MNSFVKNMKFVSSLFVIGFFYQALSQAITSCKPGGLNLKNFAAEISSFLSQKTDNFIFCEEGFQLKVSDDFAYCVELGDSATVTETRDGASEDQENIASHAASSGASKLDSPVFAEVCPSEGCPIIPICQPGYHILIHEDNCCCVEEDIAPKSQHDAEISPNGSVNVETTNEPEVIEGDQAPNIAPDCPSEGCVENAACNQGYHLLIHDDNCCCVKKDVALE